MTWPDIAVLLVVVLGVLRGFKRGLVGELAGTLALVFAIAAGFHYSGIWDAFMREHFRLSGASAHVAGMLAYAAAAYTVVLVLGAALSVVAKLPLLGLGNAFGGALVGGAKAVVLAWVILYVVLFLPLPPSVRADLHRSVAVALLQRPTQQLDAALRASLPTFLQPFAAQFFSRHER